MFSHTVFLGEFGTVFKYKKNIIIEIKTICPHLFLVYRVFIMEIVLRTVPNA